MVTVGIQRSFLRRIHLALPPSQPFIHCSCPLLTGDNPLLRWHTHSFPALEDIPEMLTKPADPPGTHTSSHRMGRVGFPLFPLALLTCSHPAQCRFCSPVVKLLRAECVKQVQGVSSEEGQDPEDNQHRSLLLSKEKKQSYFSSKSWELSWAFNCWKIQPRGCKYVTNVQ